MRTNVLWKDLRIEKKGAQKTVIPPSLQNLGSNHPDVTLQILSHLDKVEITGSWAVQANIPNSLVRFDLGKNGLGLGQPVAHA